MGDCVRFGHHGQEIAPLNSQKDVERVVTAIKQDPAVNERFLSMLIDNERAVIESERNDRADARRTFGDQQQNGQATTVLWMSFGILLVIIGATTLFVAFPPDVGLDKPNRDFVLQFAGAAIGFLTGIGGMFARSFGSVFDYFYGSSFGSKQKNDQISQLVAANAAVVNSAERAADVTPTPAKDDAADTPISRLRDKMKATL